MNGEWMISPAEWSAQRTATRRGLRVSAWLSSSVPFLILHSFGERDGRQPAERSRTDSKAQRFKQPS